MAEGRPLRHGPEVDVVACAPAFSLAATYTGGAVVSRAGVNHTAQWWTRGEVPGSTVWGAWDAGQPCSA
ncbi:carbohydrate-binding protein [Oerskovia sp. M15]